MTENVRIFSLETRGVETVKELKEQIRELRKGLVQLDETSEEYEKQVKDLTNAEETLERVMKSNSKQTVAATGSYNALVEEMSALKRVWREVNSEAERAKIGKRIAEINTQLKQMDASLGNFQRNVGNYEGALRNVFMTPQQEIKKLRAELAGLTEGTKEYNDVFLRMADLTTKVQKQQELLKYSSADLGNILTNVAGVASSVVGESVNKHSDAVRSVSLISNLLVVALVLAHSVFDSPFDIVLGHVLTLGIGDDSTQSRIVLWFRSAGLDSDSYLFAYLGKRAGHVSPSLQFCRFAIFKCSSHISMLYFVIISVQHPVVSSRWR